MFLHSYLIANFLFRIVQVEPSTRLFAAVFYRPTVKEAIHFEFGRRNRYTLPITASMLRPPRYTSTVLPHRLRVQALEVFFK